MGFCGPGMQEPHVHSDPLTWKWNIGPRNVFGSGSGEATASPSQASGGGADLVDPELNVLVPQIWVR